MIQKIREDRQNILTKGVGVKNNCKVVLMTSRSFLPLSIFKGVVSMKEAVMVAILTALFCLVFVWFVFADTVDVTVGEITDAIYAAEGGAGATYLYGIRSVSYRNEAEARRICVNSIRNNIKRWAQAGKPGDFLEFMSRRYCPVGCDNDRGTNQYWVRNVRSFLLKQRGA